MKKKHSVLIFGAVLVIGLMTLSSCKQNVVEEPSPIGPSTFAYILKVTLSPNVLLAGLGSREATTVTATLKKYDGGSVPNRTVFFEVVDIDGNRLDLGHFEGTGAVFTQNTDGSGTVRVTYFGPLAEEIVTDGSLFIRATAAWDGAQFLVDQAPLYVVRDSDALVLEAKAIPDILYAGDTNPAAEIRARVTKGGLPLNNFPVYFIVDRTQNLGRFADGKRNTFVLTNADGIASIIYYGPAFYEILSNTTVSIRVQVSQELYQDVTIAVIRQR